MPDSSCCSSFLGITRITKSLWLSGFPSTKDLICYRFTFVLCVCPKRPTLPNRGVNGVWISVTDSEMTNIRPFFIPAANLIDEQIENGEKVLIHCRMGRSRSVTILLAYLMYKQHLSLRKAMELVKVKRPVVKVNRGFARQLLRFELDIFGFNTITEEEMHPTTCRYILSLLTRRI